MSNLDIEVPVDCMSVEESLAQFLPYLEDPHFYGAVVSVDSGLFYNKGSIFDKSVRFFNEKCLNIIVSKQPRKITFSSGAVVGFLSVEQTCGKHLSVAMIVDDPNLTFRDIQWVKTRLRRPCVDMGKYWFLNINSI